MYDTPLHLRSIEVLDDNRGRRQAFPLGVRSWVADGHETEVIEKELELGQVGDRSALVRKGATP